MKKIVLLLLPFFLLSCSSSDNEQAQDYTSFVVTIEANNDFRNCVAGYYGKDGLCHKIGDLGNLGSGRTSPEIILEDDSICNYDIHIFYDLYDDVGMFDMTGRSDLYFSLVKEEKNILKLIGYWNGTMVSKNDPNQYPH